ncbi:hypothetical protein H6G03_25525 [Planktothrix sp. FACHB-1375]|uniref:Uncharacterized protein n=1 Tax=Aerosakkonema funiforme FACHB-1375 TaxID=2949571 RepID=A0A926ZIG3_9CYAN|nr:hypothetical protein [Aerosakkonema funiforme FACHB-1375]
MSVWWMAGWFFYRRCKRMKADERGCGDGCLFGGWLVGFFTADVSG